MLRQIKFSLKRLLRKNPTPFMELFTYIPPDRFITMFNQELPQTIAFLLSFCPQKRYVKKVISLFDEQEKALEPHERTSFCIREYLNRCYKESFDYVFVRNLEEEIDRMLMGYKHTLGLRRQRKKLL